MMSSSWNEIPFEYDDENCIEVKLWIYEVILKMAFFSQREINSYAIVQDLSLV